RQRNSLKRQAGKARRYIELRNRMREILSSVFSTRAEMLIHQQEAVESALASIGDEGRRLESEIERLNALVHQRRIDVAAAEKTLSDSHTRHSEVELEHEKTSQRIARLEDQIRSLEERKTTLKEERSRIADELTRNQAEHAARVTQMEETEQGKIGVVEAIERMKVALTGLTNARSSEEMAIDQLRRQQFEIVGNEARIGNEIGTRREMIRRCLAQIERLENDASEAVS